MTIPRKESRILLQKSGNRCAFPQCRRLLTSEACAPNDSVVLGDIAHIVAERQDGPRGDSPLSLAERNKYDNLILLCTQHHRLVDVKPHEYTVERLRAIKEDHEAWVQSRLAFPDESRTDTAPPKTEKVFSTLLPVQTMPRYVYGVPCDLRNGAEVAGRLLPLKDGEMAPFILREGMLFTFQNMNMPRNPFADLVPGRSAERYLCHDWWNDPDHTAWFLDLTNRTLNKLTGRKGLMLDREHRRYYFDAPQPGCEFEVRYRPLNQRTSRRKVVWRRRSKRTGQLYGYWYHRAVSLRFRRINDTGWVLTLRPELRVTMDGLNPPRSDRIGRAVTRQKSRRFNYDLLSEVNFWRDYLSGGQPRIIMSFGAGQAMVISTEIMNGEITWPGIPEEHAKSFTNVTYLDNLFSWAELTRLDISTDDWEGHDEYDLEE